MIARISGTLIYKSVTHVVVDAHGIGYRVFVPLTTFYELPETGQDVTLNVHTNVKQDAIALFGFHTNEEKDIFQLMISVTGIGPKLSMNILSGISAEDLIKAVSQGNLTRLIAIPGVGRKMAERMILELKDKVMQLGPDMVDHDVGVDMTESEQVKEDAISALVNLGYKRNMAGDVINSVIRELPEPITIDVLLKKTLKVLSG